MYFYLTMHLYLGAAQPFVYLNSINWGKPSPAPKAIYVMEFLLSRVYPFTYGSIRLYTTSPNAIPQVVIPV